MISIRQAEPADFDLVAGFIRRKGFYRGIGGAHVAAWERRRFQAGAPERLANAR